MIQRIYLDLDDVLNTLGPYVLHTVGCSIGPSEYEQYPKQFGWAIHKAANWMLGKNRYTAASFWSSIPRAVWAKCPKSDFFQWLLDTCETAVGRENLCIATSPTKDPESLAGKLEWIHDHCPEWLHRQFAITPRKWLFARPDSLLIDDRDKNVYYWRRHGGPAIMVPRPWNNLRGHNPRQYLEENLAYTLQKPL